MSPVAKTPQRLGATIGVAAFLWTMLGAPAGAEPTDWRDKVAPKFFRQRAEGRDELILFLDDQADLTRARNETTKGSRTRFVVRALTAHARRSQAPIVAKLERLGLEYRALWVANMIWVRGAGDDLAYLAGLPAVRRVEANPRIPVPVPLERRESNDKGAAVEWGLQAIGADQVWLLGYDGTGIVIGGQDTGYDWDHPALRDHYRGWNGTVASHDHNWHDAVHSGGGICGADSPAPCDDHGHGTHTMGTMVGDDGGSNRVGVSPGARWIGCRNMDQGNGTPLTYSECFQWFLAPTDANDQNPSPSLAPDVINNSWVCPPSEGCSSDTLGTIVENVRAAGIVVVASAGNSGPLCSTVLNPPSIFDATVSVGATDINDQIASFSARGPVLIDGSGRLKPDLSAPGVGVRSSFPGTGYGSLSGTSMAGPHVAGAVALLLDAIPSIRGQVDAIEAILENAAEPLISGQSCGVTPGTDAPNNTFGYGRLDVLTAVTGDADGDQTPNVADCRPLDLQRWSSPTAISDLTVARDGSGVTLSWGEPAELGAQSVTYEALRSSIPDGFGAATCIATDSAARTAADGSSKTVARFYLVRVGNACGESVGKSTGGERSVAICP